MSSATGVGEAKAGAPPIIAAVVFDMGGVLTEDPFTACDEYSLDLGLPESTFSDLIRDSPGFRAVETGASTMRDFLKASCIEIQDRYGVRVDIRRLADAMAAGQRVRPEMVELIRELSGTGTRLALLTNNVREARAWWRSGVLPIDAFEVVVDSSEVGVRKPDPRIFAEVLKRLDMHPAPVLFVDDTPSNVSAAHEVGMTSVLFTSPQQFRSELVARGVLPA
ncbi:HAD family hydrolase [Nocardia sp. NPDC052278]|uniref:HAD family hydrolase n=1 Tax=unclassified Nocardia TaxID=2637762 RepID=UPI0036A71B74